MKEKIFLVLLAMLSLFSLASADSTLTWGFTHKMEFTLLVIAVLALCFTGRAQADNPLTEFQTLRFLLHHRVAVNNTVFHRSHCDCGAHLKSTGRVAQVLLYTRNGTQKAQHAEYRSH